jgi:hypothetical protein
MRTRAAQAPSRPGGIRRNRRGDDTAPVGSVTGQPVQVQFSCKQFVCVQLQFRWAAAGPANITGIVPAPTAAEKNKITAGLFGPNPMAPLQLPPQVTVLPCLLDCNCVNVRWAAWTPNPIPQTVTKDVDLLQAGQPAKTFTVTLSIPATVRQGVGGCQ